MKKLDLHIHTIQTISDCSFDFSIKKLKEYIRVLKIDGIAITNHNSFDLLQYKEIQKELLNECIVLPGIEINIGKNSCGHLICIAEQEDADDFALYCQEISRKIIKSTDFISFEELKRIFPTFNKYLWIPHIDKKPALDSDIVKLMNKYILCGEVGSVKKFVYRQKDLSSLIPVYFSDIRPTDNLDVLPSRQTFFDLEEITVSSIKKTLINRNHVTLTEAEGNKLFNILPDLPISTGLTVVIGERSSGKTFLLNQISEQYQNIKYIKQFSLIETKPEQDAKKFTDQIAAKRNGFAEEYFSLFKDAVDEVKDISLDDDSYNLEQYITSLIKFAMESDRADMFAKCALYNESKYQLKSFDNIIKLIDSVICLLDAREYREIIKKHISRKSLIELLVELVDCYRNEKRQSLEEIWVNNLIGSIKRKLRLRTSATTVPEFDFYKCQMNRIKVHKFNELVNVIKQESVINCKNVGGFEIRTSKRSYSNANELKQASGRKNVHFLELMDKYADDPYRYLLGLTEMGDIPESDYYKLFVYIDYQILNQYGFSISGGERAEFKLLQEIDDAHIYDLLLIDEPESSFDNLFLRDRVNSIIRELSSNMPVIIVTHNNTVGASIKPDFLVYTQRIVDKEVTYKRFYGLPSDKALVSSSGETIKNIQAVMDCLEAGKTAYNERKHNYGLLED